MTDRAARCETCIYYVAVSVYEEGRCHAQPPQVVQDSEHAGGAWPMVYARDWCGHYRPNAEALAALVEAQP